VVSAMLCISSAIAAPPPITPSRPVQPLDIWPSDSTSSLAFSPAH
jgi:hypothetical protein